MNHVANQGTAGWPCFHSGKRGESGALTSLYAANEWYVWFILGCIDMVRWWRTALSGMYKPEVAIRHSMIVGGMSLALVEYQEYNIII